MTNFDANMSSIQKLLDCCDHILRPQVLIINPKHKEIITEEIESQVKVVYFEAIEPDKAYLMNRDEYEKMINIDGKEAQDVRSES